ncbi:uncharacterized protein PV07_05989 [Cladophialophora immunda]|uniref:Uncharacterized protein n=1 Tax=Cladophialophora immunda TaxID=569365 RepID=A0A0D2CJE0_9EURO|nr:uncharacterized protein PV07_05989 [Cladophialophora immunda]KIW30230.1 hypothetical protein PV07_05989 [Cladophialophora immunda]
MRRIMREEQMLKFRMSAADGNTHPRHRKIKIELYAAISSSAALVRVLLINGATLLPFGAMEPNDNTGFGRANLANSLTIVQGEAGTGRIEHTFDATHGNPFIHSFNCTEVSDFKVTLVWSDPPGPKIQNQLTLQVTSSAQPDIKRLDPARGPQLNIVQQVLWYKMPPGTVAMKVQYEKSARERRATFLAIMVCPVVIGGATS